MSKDALDDAMALIRALPPVFTYMMATDAGMSKSTFYRLRDRGLIDQVGHGRYQVAGADLPADMDLLEIAQRAPRSTICLTSALARHNLIDDIPAEIDIAIPRDHWRPETEAPVAWHMFDQATFDVGRGEIVLDQETTIGLYSPERSIIDAFRLRHREGSELGVGALKRWLRRPGASAAQLMAMAQRFPQARKALQQTLEILL